MAKVKIGNNREIQLLTEKKNPSVKHITMGNFFGELTGDKSKTNGNPLLKLSKDGKNYYIREKFEILEPQDCDYYFETLEDFENRIIEICEENKNDLSQKTFGFSNEVTDMNKKFPNTIISTPKFIYGNEITSLSCFYNCVSLTEISDVLLTKLPKLNDLSSLFSGCSSISNVPSNLFESLFNITDISSLFQNCTSLTSIPENIFKNTINVNSITSLFDGCNNLKTIPQRIFYNMPKIENANKLFRKCSSLNSIPDELFKNNVKITSFSNCFSECISLEYIPDDLTIYSEQITYATEMFSECSSLKLIPSTLFNKIKPDKSAIYLSLTGVFRNCTSLISIPVDLFRTGDFSILNRIDNMFENCSSLTDIPIGIFDNLGEKSPNGNISANSTFKGCTSLTVLKSNLFLNVTLIIDNMFLGCTGLTTIEKDVFGKNCSPSNEGSTFKNCTNLKTINKNMFNGIGEFAYKFTSMFEGCSKLERIEDGTLFFNPDKPQYVISSMFKNCTSLTYIPKTIFDSFNNNASVSCRSTFENCINLTSDIPELWNKNLYVVRNTKYAYGCTKASNYNKIPEDWK